MQDYYLARRKQNGDEKYRAQVTRERISRKKAFLLRKNGQQTCGENKEVDEKVREQCENLRENPPPLELDRKKWDKNQKSGKLKLPVGADQIKIAMTDIDSGRTIESGMLDQLMRNRRSCVFDLLNKIIELNK
ncbi:hypothetical protein MHBO_004256 [Bonamia ostreae]|uniref:Uncharacterized protein n=1 Tax=Bonamia ostreae TaxID=126728 RepID=A0ABV2ATL3_9EUKA